MDKEVKAATKVIGGFGFGIILAFIEKTLYDEGILIDEFITGTVTLADLMIVTVIIWAIIGVILAVTQ